jgi:hypothetical protein
MIVAKLVSLSLTGESTNMLSFNAYTRAEKWIKEFCPKSEKMLIAHNYDHAVNIIHDNFKIPLYLQELGVSNRNIMLHFASSTVEHNTFWEPCGIVHTCRLSSD